MELGSGEREEEGEVERQRQKDGDRERDGNREVEKEADRDTETQRDRGRGRETGVSENSPRCPPRAQARDAAQEGQVSSADRGPCSTISTGQIKPQS